MKFNILKTSCFAVLLAAGIFAGCTPDEVTNGNPLTEADLNASFTSVMAGTDEDGNVMYNFEGANDANIQYHTWKVVNAVNGSAIFPNQGESKSTVNTFAYTFGATGTYKVQHRVVGRVGGTNFISEQTFDIEIEEQETGDNIIASPNFETPSDWTVLNIAATGEWTFNTGSATIAGGANTHKAIYQAVEVEAGTYNFDMNVAGPGSVNTWFEVYISPTAPTQNSDYSAGGKRLQLNTWAGCATSPFDGLLTVVGCGLNDVSGPEITFDAPQTVYFLIKCGATGDGNVNSITVSNVTMVKQQ